ncbi:MAG: ABC transporter ATP-binding protein [Acidobacteria bacterium]|nr:ABC transporter ATP-binding protein [Acidobacteriota bacterium]
MLEVRGLAKRFGGLMVLEGVTFDVAPGEVLGLIGPNGAGKTTLLECLAGLLPLDAGEVLMDGRTLSPRSLRAALFYLPDGISPWAEHRASFVLDTMAELLGARDALPLVRRTLTLGDVLGGRVASLSKGQRKRLLLAIALLAPRPYLLLDEPFDGLDLSQTRTVTRVLRQHAKETGRALVVSIHQLVDASRVSDRLLLLSGGRVAGQGTLEALRERADLPGASLEEVFLALS